MPAPSFRVERLEDRRLLSVGGLYAPPAPTAVEIDQNPGWRFRYNPANDAQGDAPQSPAYDESNWTNTTLPHTWNTLDGATSNYAAGTGWYRKTITVGADLSGKQLYFKFEGGSLSTSLYVDGVQIDFNPNAAGTNAHDGGFQTFLFDVTSQLTPGNHLIAVRVNNQSNANVAPAGSGDYSKLGGLYRDVSLLALNKTHLAVDELVTHGDVTANFLTPVATTGVYFRNGAVTIGASAANVSVRSVLDNLTGGTSVNVTSYLVDAAGVIRAEQTSNVGLTTGQRGVSVTHDSVVANPRLWDGRIDPYRYDLYVEVRDASTNALVDVRHQKVGIRSFKLNAVPNTGDADPTNDAPFMLNGRPYKLVGANIHHDSGRLGAGGNPVAWAQTRQMIYADVDMLVEMGGTIIRTAHYQHDQALYDRADELGLFVYTETPINGNHNASDAFMINAQDQYHELIRQNFNHPSVFAWGYANETTNSADLVRVFTQLKRIAGEVDGSTAGGFINWNRPTAYASYSAQTTNAASAHALADIKGVHPYDYWYGGDMNGSIVNHTAFSFSAPQPLGVTEFGGGSSAYQYMEGNSATIPNNPASVTTRYHPQNAQTVRHERHYTEMSTLNYLWGAIVWQMFDMASTGKQEGEQLGVNDKGLVTRDRVRKDSFYYYKATWNDPARSYANEKVLEISDKFWTVRNTSAAEVMVFSNVGAPTLFQNGVSLGTMAPLQVVTKTKGTLTVPNAYVMNVNLAVGGNALEARRTYAGNGQTYANAANWTYYGAAHFNGNGNVATNVPVNTTFTMNWFTLTPTNQFSHALPNGTYDVRVNAPAGTSGSPRVNNVRIEGQTAGIDTNGLDVADTYYTRVTVTDGTLTLTAAPGAVFANVTSIDIKGIGDVPGPNAPSGLAAASVSDTRIDLSWADNSTDEDEFRVERSADGVSGWAQVGTAAANQTTFQATGLTAGARYFFRVAAHDETGTSPASNVADNYAVNNALPAPWGQAEVGAAAVAGSGRSGGGVFVIEGAGGDVWGTADQFRFASVDASGNHALVVRVDRQTNTDPWAKAGLMFRDGTAAGAVNAYLALTPGNGVTFQRRTATGGTTVSTSVAGVAGPVWLKLVRSGNSFTAFYGSNGTTWTQVGTAQTVTMPTTVKAGLAVTSHNAAARSLAAFSNVSVAGAAVPTAQPFAFEEGQSVTVNFSQPMNNGSITASDLAVRAVDATGNPIGPVLTANAVTFAGNTATFRFTTPLGNGNYRAALAAGAVTDANGFANTAATGVDFFVLAGDANRDRIVDTADFLIWRASANTQPATFSRGDFNYDDLIDTADFLIWRANANVSVPAPPPPTVTATSATATQPSVRSKKAALRSVELLGMMQDEDLELLN